EPPPTMVAGPTIMRSSVPHARGRAKERSRGDRAKLAAMTSRTDIQLPDALVREVEWIDPGRLAAALEAGGKMNISLLESGLPESPWGIWTFLAWDPVIGLEHDGHSWIPTLPGAPDAFFKAIMAGRHEGRLAAGEATGPVAE